MKEIIRNLGWIGVRSNTGGTYYSAVDKPFLQHTMELEVIVENSPKVLVNGALYHATIIPSLEEAAEFCSELADN